MTYRQQRSRFVFAVSALDSLRWTALRPLRPFPTQIRSSQIDIRQIFAYSDSVMAFGIQERRLFVVECKRCRRDVPSGVKEFPFRSIVVTCPLCGDQRQYLPSEVFLGRPNHLIAKQARA